MNTMNPASASPVEHENVNVDRDIPQLQTKKKKNGVKRLAITVAILLAVVLMAIGAALFMQRLKERAAQQKADKVKQQNTVATSEVATLNLEAVKKRIKAEDEANQPPPQTTPASQLPPPSGAIAVVPTNGAPGAASARMAAGGANGAGGSMPNGANGAGGAGGPGQPSYAGQQRQQVETPRQRRLSGDVLVATSGEQQMAMPARNGDTGSMPAPLGMPRMEANKSGLEESLKPSQLQATSASRHRSLDLMLLASTTIPCGQRTLIVSTNPGQTSCTVSKDVYSANGSTLLIERGSQVLGERSQPLQLGQELLPVLWNRIVTPRGVVIDINSLATDTLGASGLLVYVDEHWRKRFGAAIMLSLIGDLGQAAANKASNAEGTIRLTTTANAGQDLAARALDKTINIPPTGYSLQGEAINIFVARDLDFGRVYELARY
jgi:type IV secretion system protein VirB10